MDNDKLRAAGRVAGKMVAEAGKDWAPVVRNSGQFVKHVVPAAVKPIHALWHQLLAFLFFLFAGSVAWRGWKARDTTSPALLGLIGFFALVMMFYGVSSLLKARRISRK